MKLTTISLLVCTLSLCESAIGGQNAFYFSGSPLSFIAGGTTQLLTPDNGYTITAAGDSEGVEINATKDSIYWITFFAGIHSEPQVGYHADAIKWPFNEDQNKYGLSFYGNGKADDVTGAFNVLEAVYDANGGCDQLCR